MAFPDPDPRPQQPPIPPEVEATEIQADSTHLQGAAAKEEARERSGPQPSGTAPSAQGPTHRSLPRTEREGARESGGTIPLDRQYPAKRPDISAGLPGESALDEVETQTPRSGGSSGPRSGKIKKVLTARGAPMAPGYETLEPLGAGTYGEVWKARDLNTNKIVALKFFTKGAIIRMESLVQEVKQLALLANVHGIVHIHEVDTDNEPPFYAMSYAEGGSVGKLMRLGEKARPLPLDVALPLFQQTARALAVVHNKGIRHCDLKPDNLLLDAHGEVVVGDFGQAHLLDDETPTLGTFFFMAPEQANLCDQAPDGHWDVYGLGAVFYAMLVGEPPRYDEKIRMELKKKLRLSERLECYRAWIQNAPPPSEHRQVAGMDRALAQIIDRCLEADAEKRFRDAGGILAALEQRERQRQQRPLILVGFLAPLLLLVLMAVGASWARVAAVTGTGDALIKQQLGRQEVSARLAARVVQNHLHNSIAVLHKANNEALMAALQSGRQEELEDLLQQIMESADAIKPKANGKSARNRHSFRAVAVADRTGHLRAVLRWDPLKTPPMQRLDLTEDKYRKNFGHRGWFNGVRNFPADAAGPFNPLDNTTLFVSEPYVSAEGEIGVGLSMPIKKREMGEAPVGVLMGFITMAQIQDWLAEVNQSGEFAVLIDRRGYCLLHRDDEAVRQKITAKSGSATSARFDFSPVVREVEDQERARSRRAETALTQTGASGVLPPSYRDPVDGEEYLVGFAGLQDDQLPWVVLVQQKKERALSLLGELQTHLNWIGLWGLLLVAGGVGILWGWLCFLLRRRNRLDRLAGV